ncbi:DUF3373 domain-containing protein [Geomonas paludis]|uniref:DUF3373 domain-containing protein n=1 Tax=Geomonas paludis TaxID=2740185 RepID=A0A6V8MSM6_9BACT|nr:DUF3373 domain-containing protein [Geomonas paludis]UPU35292.1 DUF3373 domain-containing protein [Geomonas paludis]GFO63148.1 hypothetical protein GMPD_10670 [Geomonas paludis]
MKKLEKLLIGAAVCALAAPVVAQADDQDMQKKIDELTKKVQKLEEQQKSPDQKKIEDLTRKVDRIEEKSLGKWLTIGGDYRFRVDSLRGDVAAHSDAIGTMNNLVGAFVVGPNAVAGLTVGDNAQIVNPSGTAFMFQGKAGSLFTPAQFNTILNNYMPSAMYNAFIGQIMPALGGMTPTDVNNYLAANRLTAQQQGILATLTQKGVMDKVMSMMTPANQAAFAALPPAYQQAAMVMAMQGFLGAGSGNLATTQSYKAKNDLLYTNRLGIDLHAKATKDVTVNVRLVAYKTFGSQDDSAVTNNGNTPFFADRVGVFDGTLGHVPSSSLLDVDRAYATWSNIADQPIWFSVGRRPSTNGAPSNLRLNNERPGNGGTPALLVDYAFDGMTIGWAPDIEALPGAYAKVCYGRGFESGFETPSNSLKDTDMLGVAIIPVDTDPLRVWLQWNRGFEIFDFPVMSNTAFGNTGPATSLGDIDWYGAGFMSTLKNIGPGKLNFFADAGLSVTHPNGNVSNNAGFQGLMTGSFFNQEAPSDKTGWAAYAGARYDYEPTRTKFGIEYNHGSKNWITFAPAADDMWTSKLGTRGDVYEAYLIQELNLKPVSSHLSKAFFKIGYQYYDFAYTGSNNWVGAPQKISDIKSTDLMLLQPLKSAQDIYATFEVKF